MTTLIGLRNPMYNPTTPNLISDSNFLILRLSNEVSFFSKFLLKGAQKAQKIKVFKWINACKS